MLEKHLETASNLLKISESRVRVGTALYAEVGRAKAYCLDLKITMLRERIKNKAARN